MRVYELARELGVDSSELLARAQQLGVDVTSIHSSLDEEAVKVLRGWFQNRERGQEDWMDLDRVLVALQSTLERADRRLKARAEGDLQYAVTDFRIDLPAEVRVEANGRTVVRFPRRREGEEPPIPESHLSRLVFSLKPILTLEKEP